MDTRLNTLETSILSIFVLAGSVTCSTGPDPKSISVDSFQPNLNVAKRFDGVSWEVFAVFDHDAEWSSILEDFRKEKRFYSYGSCCSNAQNKGALLIEGEEPLALKFFITDVTPNGRNRHFQMYWREGFIQEYKSAPGYTRTASKALGRRIDKFFRQREKLEAATSALLERCVGVEYAGCGNDRGCCRSSFEVSSKFDGYNADSTAWTNTTRYQVFLNQRYRENQAKEWTVILDTCGKRFLVPNEAMGEFAKTQSRFATFDPKSGTLQNAEPMIRWAMNRELLAIRDARTNTLKKSVFHVGVTRRCGNMCDSGIYFLVVDSDTLCLGGYEH